MAATAVETRENRPAYVRFERIVIEDKEASIKAGRYVGREIDMALITPSYSRDVFKQKVPQWLAQLEADLLNERIPAEWVANYKKAYELWKNGQEIPLNGTPIRGWQPISPAQQESLVRLNILTVEDLAGVNDEGIKRIGMGAVEMKQKALAWLAAAEDKGRLSQEVSRLMSEVRSLTQTVKSQQETIEALKGARADDPVIELGDIQPDAYAGLSGDELRTAYRERFGRLPPGRPSEDKMREELRAKG